MITQEDIARELGLSLMTVYRFLSGSGTVSAKTSKRIEDFIRQHNYRPNLMARSLKLRKSNIIGLLVPSFTYSYYPEIIESIRETLGSRYNLLLCLSSEDGKTEREELKMLMTIPVAGILMSPVNGAVSIDNCRYMDQHRMPYVLFDRYFSENELDCSYVSTDCFEASRALIHYLFEIGHRKIAHAGGVQDNSFARKMFEGYCCGLKECGLAFDEKKVRFGGLNDAAGRNSIRQWAADGFDFTAIHSANDPIAIGIMEGCRELQINIPEDISITGFSDIAIARNVYVPLTTVKEATDEIGRIAAETLISMIENPDTAEKVTALLPGEFVKRQSCRRL